MATSQLPPGAVPATFAAVATVPAIAAPSELVPPYPSDTSDPWPSLRLFGDEDPGVASNGWLGGDFQG